MSLSRRSLTGSAIGLILSPSFHQHAIGSPPSPWEEPVPDPNPPRPPNRSTGALRRLTILSDSTLPFRHLWIEDNVRVLHSCYIETPRAVLVLTEKNRQHAIRIYRSPKTYWALTIPRIYWPMTGFFFDGTISFLAYTAILPGESESARHDTSYRLSLRQFGIGWRLHPTAVDNIEFSNSLDNNSVESGKKLIDITGLIVHQYTSIGGSVGGQFRPEIYLMNTPRLNDSFVSVCKRELLIVSAHASGMDVRFKNDVDDPFWKTVDVSFPEEFDRRYSDGHVVTVRTAVGRADVTHAYEVDGIAKVVLCTIELSRVGWRVTHRRDTMFVPRIRKFPPK